MGETKSSWIEQYCAQLVPIERETLEKLGEEKGQFFRTVAEDWFEINSALLECYPGRQSCNLVVFTFWGLFKEVCWLHFFFLAGNYPLLLSRMRFIWESVFRAYFAEHYPLGPCQQWDIPGPNLDDKLAWLDVRGKHLRWDTCIEPVLKAIFALSAHEQGVRAYYDALFKSLHQFAHPSAHLVGRLIGDSALHVKDGFDETWARDTNAIGVMVFDLIWLAVLVHHPKALERVKPLTGKYPILQIAFKDENAGE